MQLVDLGNKSFVCQDILSVVGFAGLDALLNLPLQTASDLGEILVLISELLLRICQLPL